MTLFIIAYCEEGGEGGAVFSGLGLLHAAVLIFSYGYAKICPYQ